MAGTVQVVSSGADQEMLPFGSSLRKPAYTSLGDSTRLKSSAFMPSVARRKRILTTCVLSEVLTIMQARHPVVPDRVIGHQS